MKKTLLVVICLFVFSALSFAAAGYPSDPYPQPTIAEKTSGPIWNQYWVDNCLDLNIDMVVLGVDVIAYKIRWFNGNWSGWFVPGNGDGYQKSGEPPRRYWACFNDHTHKYIYMSYPRFTPLKPIMVETTVENGQVQTEELN